MAPAGGGNTGLLLGSLSGTGSISAGSLLVIPTGTAMGTADTHWGDDQVVVSDQRC